MSDYLSGKKTFIVAGIVAGVTFAQMVGWISAEAYQGLLGLLAAAGLYTVRDAIRKLE